MTTNNPQIPNAVYPEEVVMQPFKSDAIEQIREVALIGLSTGILLGVLVVERFVFCSIFVLLKALRTAATTCRDRTNECCQAQKNKNFLEHLLSPKN